MKQATVVIIIDDIVQSALVWAVSMAAPTTLFNNLVKKEGTTNTYIDPISKAFLTAETLLGINRLVTYDRIKPPFKFLASVYSLFLCILVLYSSFFFDVESLYNASVQIDSLHYILSIIVSWMVRKRLLNYYRKLHEFDVALGCRPKTTASSIKNLIQVSLTTLLMTFTVPYELFMSDTPTALLHAASLPFRLLYVIDIHFYGHLLSLLVPRHRIINYYMRVSLNDHKQAVAPKMEELKFKSATLETHNCQMEKLMDQYYLIINAYDVLINAIKWQFIMVLTSMFISILTFSYMASLMVLRTTRPFLNIAMETGYTATRLLPLFAPCVFADQIQEEVRRLRELLASRLYENKLNKPGRSAARSLLALTQAQPLSFSLLQIFDIDISLPFKFMGLLLTYLIILLQFEKIINP